MQICVDCIQRLTNLSPRRTLHTAIEQCFTGLNQRDGQVVVQTTESTFISQPGNLTVQIDLGYRQLWAYAMRHFLKMPKQPKREDLLAKPIIQPDKTVLHDFADLALRLGFESPEITNLKKYSRSTPVSVTAEKLKPLLVIDGQGEKVKRRCGLPHTQVFEEDCDFLFIHYLHDENHHQAEGITSFFVRRSVYFAFFGRSTWSDISNSSFCSTSGIVGENFVNPNVTSESQERIDHESQRHETGHEEYEQGQQLPEQKSREILELENKRLQLELLKLKQASKTREWERLKQSRTLSKQKEKNSDSRV